MRVAMDARLLYYRQGGTAVYIRQVLRALADLDTRTNYFVLHSRRDRQTFTPGENFRRANLWTPSHHRLEKWTLSAELLLLRPDILHCPDFIPPLWGARRTVITVHDLNFLHYPEFLTSESRRYYNGQIARATRQADHIMAVSAATRDDLVNLLGVPAEKITVQVEGVEPTFQPLPEEVVAAGLESLGLPREYLLFVGTFEPRKNIPGLLQAYHHLQEKQPDAPPLVLAGRRGWLIDDLTAQVTKLGLDAHVIWCENPAQSLMPALFNGARLLAMPSFYEGFGLPALEAMACGTPTVVANRSALPEIVGEAGILVDPDDPVHIAEGLYRLLNDTDLRARLRTAGLARAEQFTWQRAAETILHVYRLLVS